MNIEGIILENAGEGTGDGSIVERILHTNVNFLKNKQIKGGNFKWLEIWRKKLKKLWKS